MDQELESTSAAACEGIYPRAFSLTEGVGDLYLGDPLIKLLAEFFWAKGLAAIKEEDRAEKWYDDWLAYQKRHGIYAQLIAPKELSSLGGELDLFRLTRFLEVFGYFSAAHGYSLQVSFLGLFPILMGENMALKREAVALLEAGGLFAFGVSEQAHGSDLFGNEFTVTETEDGQLVARGTKYYIGNSNCAEMISILARRIDRPVNGRVKRAPFVLFALRPGKCAGFKNNRKIRTLGVRAAFVGGFEVTDHRLAESDIYAQGREAWDAVFGTVTLGKLAVGQAFATIVYGQLVAENAAKLKVSPEMAAAIFHMLVADLTTCAVQLAALPRLGSTGRAIVGRMMRIPRTSAEEWEFVAGRVAKGV